MEWEGDDDASQSVELYTMSNGKGEYGYGQKSKCGLALLVCIICVVEIVMEREGIKFERVEIRIVRANVNLR